jgi:hypothetical protein
MHVTKELSASLDYFRLMFVFSLADSAESCSGELALSLFPSADSCAIF